MNEVNKVKIANKGFTLTVKSWENDGDSPQTHSKTFETLKEAEFFQKICKELFISHNQNEIGIGNLVSWYGPHIEESKTRIIKYMKGKSLSHTSLYNNNHLKFLKIMEELMGESYEYSARICESAIITYSEVDIYDDKVEF